MSSSAEVRALRDEVESLRAEVSRLARQLESLERLVHTPLAPPFELVGDEGYVGGIVADSADPSEQGPYSWTFRESVAKEVGVFIKKELQGEIRMISGREKIRELKTRFYLIARGFDGTTYNPVVVTTTLARARQLCQRGSEFGRSFFIGVPTTREGRIAVLEAGLTWV